MRILLVDAYSSTDKMSDKFSELSKLIRQILLEQKDLVDREDIKIFERTRANLDDFLFELDSSYLKKSAAKLFDHVDLIVIEGDVHLLPWFPQGDKVNVLIRMCIRSKKLLFASGFAMQALVFLCASNLDKMVRVINGNGRGGKMGEALNFIHMSENLNPYHYFLDNATGDLYAFNFDSQEWVPKVNVGIHYRKAAEAFDSIGKYVLKQPVYKPKPVIESPLSYLSKNDEEFCTIKKIHLRHWAFTGITSDFKIPFKAHWDVHHFNFINNLKSFTVLAETKYGPQIIHLAPNCIGTQFTISKKYPDTVQLLKNFIVHNTREIKTSKYDNITNIEKISMQLKGSMAMFEIALSQHNSKIGNASGKRTVGLISKSLGMDYQRPPTDPNEIPHSGYAMKPRKDPLTVKNNTLGVNYAVQIQKMIENWDIKSPKVPIPQPIASKASENHELDSHGKLTPMARTNHKQKESFAQTHRTKGIEWTEAESRDEGLDASTSKSRLKKKRDLRRSTSKEVEFEPPQTPIGKAEIRRVLYPQIAKECLTEEDSWVPGSLTSRTKEKSPMRPKIRLLESASSSRFYSRYNKEFRNSNLDFVKNLQTTRCSSVYQTEQEKRAQEEKESEKKNVGPNYFKFQAKSLKPDFIPNYVTRDYSKPISDHKYRETHREKWVSGDIRI